MVKTLVISTSQPVTGVALWDRTLFEWRELASNRTGEAIRSTVEQLGDLRKVGLIAVDSGPGSYTGTRVGVAFAQGMARAMQIHWVGVTVWDILGAIAPDGADLISASRSGEVMVCRNNEVAIEPLSNLANPFGYPMLQPEKFGGSVGQAGTIPIFEQYLRSLAKLAQLDSASQRLPQYYDRFSAPGLTR